MERVLPGSDQTNRIIAFINLAHTDFKESATDSTKYVVTVTHYRSFQHQPDGTALAVSGSSRANPLESSQF